MAGELVARTVELDVDGAWQDITADVLNRDDITVSTGAPNESSAPRPGSMGLLLNNGVSAVDPSVTHRYTRQPTSDLYGVVGRGTRVRLSAGPRGGSETTVTVMEIVTLPGRSDVTGESVWVPLESAGVLRRLGRPMQSAESALRQHYEAAFGDDLVCYLPLEDGDETVQVENTVGIGVVYDAGPPPDFPRLPGFSEDDSCPGSAPLPEWPVLDYFGWSVGAVVGESAPPWQVHVVARVPPNPGELWLCEWKTDRGLVHWALKVSSGQLRVAIAEDADNPVDTTRTTSALAAVDDGAWHAIAVSVQVDSGDTTVTITMDDDQETLTNITVDTGSVTTIRPRPLYADSTDKSTVGLGHVAVLAGRVAPADVGPVQGHAGERAVERMRRLAGREDVHMRFPGLESDEDDFGRTVASGWGATELAGETWQTVVESSGSSDFLVDSGRARIVDLNDLHSVATVPGPNDVDLIARGRGTGGHFGLVLRFVDIDNWYEVSLDHGSSVLQVWVISGGIWTELAQLSTPTQFQSGRWYWIRAQMIGDRIRVRAWEDGHAEPVRWRIDVTDDTHNSGRVGAFAFSGLCEFSTWRSTAADSRSGRCGPQRVANFVNNLEDAAEVDGGLLHETRDAAGLAHRPLAQLYNRTSDVTLDYASSEVWLPYEPKPDDRGVVNVFTARRVDGGAARAEVTGGTLGTAEFGRRSRSRTYNAAGDGQLRDLASWQTHLGTWDEPRYPRIRVDMRGLSTRTGGATLVQQVAALVRGDQVTITNPPSWLPPEDVVQLVLGVRHRVSTEQWLVDLHTAPAGPYTVGTYAGADELPGEAQPQRYDTAGCETVESFTAGSDTQLVVTTTLGPAWTRNSGGLQLDGSVGNEATTPDAAALDVTGDITIIAHVTTDQWDTGSFLDFVRKWDFAGNNSYRLRLSSGDALRIHWTEDGSTDMTLDSSVAVPVPTPSPQVLATELDVDNGSSQHAARFWVADSVDGPWTELGTEQTGSGVTSIFAGTADLMVDGGNGFARTTRELQVWSGRAISDPDNATLVAGPQFEREQAGTTSFVDAAGLAWTVSGDAEITDGDLPLDLGVSGVRLRARWATAAITRVVEDTFTRTVASGWGTADTGESWTTHGDGDFSVDGSEGVVENASVDVTQAATVGDDYEDVEVLVAVTFSGSGVGDGGPVFRFASVDSHYQVTLGSPDSGTFLQALAVLDGEFAPLQTDTPAFTTTSGVQYWIRARIDGDRIRARTWEDGNSEPSDWLIDVAAGWHVSPGAAGVQHFDDGDGSLVTSWDGLRVTEPHPAQTIAVDQSPVNGVSKTIDAGADVSLWQPARYAL